VSLSLGLLRCLLDNNALVFWYMALAALLWALFAWFRPMP